MYLQEYKNMRNKVMEMNQHILELVSGDDAAQAAKILGTFENRQIVLDSPIEEDAHMDFFIYGQIFEGLSKLDIYHKNIKKENEEENNLLKIMEKAETSLYEVLETNSKDKTVLVKDVIHSPNEVFKVVDAGLSGTLDKNRLIFSRLLHFEKFSMTSGLVFIFRREHQEYLLKRSRKTVKKMKHGNDSDKRFIAFFHLNRKDGMPALFGDLE